VILKSQGLPIDGGSRETFGGLALWSRNQAREQCQMYRPPLPVNAARLVRLILPSALESTPKVPEPGAACLRG